MDYGVWISNCSQERFKKFIDMDSTLLDSDDLYINSPQHIYFNPFNDKQGKIGLFRDRLTDQTQLIYISYSWYSYCTDQYISKVTDRIESITGNRAIFTNYRALVYKDNITRELFQNIIHDIWKSYAHTKCMPPEMSELILKYLKNY